MAEVRDYKPDENTLSRFLTLIPDSDKIDKDIIGAWRRIIGGKKGIALNLYKKLLTSKKGEFTEVLSEKLNEPIYNIRRALNDLKNIGLIEKIKRKRNRVISDFWRIKEKVDGLLRLIPIEEDKPGLEGKEKFWVKRYEELSNLFTKYTGYAWILKKSIDWKIEKDGLMDYNEERKYLKLSNLTPPINYITLFSKSDNYNLQILDQNRKLFEIRPEIYEHQKNEELNIVNAIIPPDNFKNIFQKLHIGESYFIKIVDQKRLYACPKTKKTYMACFLYQINLENIDTLELNYHIHKNIHPVSCGIWYDNHKEFEFNLTSEKSGQQENINFRIKNEKNYANFYWQGNYLLNKAHVLKFLFEFQPEYESDYKQWIKMYEAIDCPFCQKIPFETIRRI